MSTDHVSKRLPSLLAVRAFEAAARHGSFTRAAAELHLTQSAISRHVRTLEAEFGVALFERRGRTIKLSEVGRTYFAAVSGGLSMIHDATRAVRDTHRRKQAVTVSMLPSVAALWFAPHISDFTQSFPDIDLRIHASRDLVDLARDGIDVCVRYGRGRWPGVDATLLATETLSPVCAPGLAADLDLAAGPYRLGGAVLLGDDLADGWAAWLDAAGLAPAQVRFGSRFNETATLYRSAAAGAGVALGRSLLTEREIAEGRLVAPFAVAVPASFSYWLVTLSGGPARPAVATFIDWVKGLP